MQQEAFAESRVELSPLTTDKDVLPEAKHHDDNLEPHVIPGGARAGTLLVLEPSVTIISALDWAQEQSTWMGCGPECHSMMKELDWARTSRPSNGRREGICRLLDAKIRPLERPVVRRAVSWKISTQHAISQNHDTVPDRSSGPGKRRNPSVTRDRVDWVYGPRPVGVFDVSATASPPTGEHGTADEDWLPLDKNPFSEPSMAQDTRYAIGC